MSIVKALVLCAGRGTRLRPLTHTRAKAALPVAGRPVLEHIVAYLRSHGFTDIGIVISPGQGELKRLPTILSGPPVAFILQKNALGIAHAVKAAASFLGREPFLLYLGDNLTDEWLPSMVDRFEAEEPDALLAVRAVTNPKLFGVVELEGPRVVRVVEKPAEPRSNLAIAGIYLFRPTILDAITDLRPSPRGELEITDAIAGLMRAGRTVLAHPMTGWWQDMGTPEGLLSANILLLDQIQSAIDPGVLLDSVRIEGRVAIGPGAVLENVRLRGPLCIGAGCHIWNSYIGPYTSVGEDSHIVHATLENSILLPHCRLDRPAFHLEDCLLGRGAVVENKSGRTATLMMGDDGRLQMPPERR
ncbi:MAG: glucose-phosphate thymidylyltransferase [Firmicutes bacterium]|nr:glucose-phosphate thymidylyltransferase [Bacillota bacterium]